MVENDDEVHPLDRDYSVPSEPGLVERTAYDPGLRKVGTITLAAGLIVMFLAAVTISNAGGYQTTEFIGSLFHRLGMVTGLIGGILIIAAYRWEQIMTLLKSSSASSPDTPQSKIAGQMMVETEQTEPTDRGRLHRFAVLCGVNVLLFAAIAVLGYVVTGLQLQMLPYILFNGALSALAAVMVTLTIFHRGFIQAYAIGVLVPLLLNWYSGTASASSGYIYSASYASGSGNWAESVQTLWLSNLAIYLVCGLICGGYVLVFTTADSH